MTSLRRRPRCYSNIYVSQPDRAEMVVLQKSYKILKFSHQGLNIEDRRAVHHVQSPNLKNIALNIDDLYDRHADGIWAYR